MYSKKKKIQLIRKIKMIEKKEEQVQRRFNEAEELQAEIERVKKLQIAQLEKIATMTASQAKDLLLKEVEDDVKHESALLIKKVLKSRQKRKLKKRRRRLLPELFSAVPLTMLPRPQFQSFHFPMMK